MFDGYEKNILNGMLELCFSKMILERLKKAFLVHTRKRVFLAQSQKASEEICQVQSERLYE